MPASSLPSPTRPAAPEMVSVVERNIAALLERRVAAEQSRRWQDRLADTITGFTGSMTFVLIHLVLFGVWIIWNLPQLPTPKFDPSYVVLAMFASVEAIFLSTFVLISQNRSAALQDKRADLDLQISLLAEHEVTRLITMVKAITKHLGLPEAEDPALHELEQNVAPEKVLDAMEHMARKTDPDA